MMQYTPLMKQKEVVSRTDVQEARARLARLITDRMRDENLDSLTEFADRFNIGRSTIYEIVRGRTRTRGAWVKPTLDTTIALANALERPLHEIIYLLEPNAPGAELASPEDASLLRIDVTVAGWVGAGPSQDDACDEPPVYVEAAFARGKALRAFRVRGDSMDAGKRPIHDGDIIIVDVLDKGYNTASVVARLQDGSYVVKMLKDDRFGKLLQSRNPEHTNGTPSAIPIEQVDEIIGRVVRIITDDEK